jgi:hypothetical protein
LTYTVKLGDNLSRPLTPRPLISSLTPWVSASPGLSWHPAVACLIGVKIVAVPVALIE